MLEYLGSKKILIVAAHPDDELLGCGATMHMLTRRFRCCVRVAILGEGLASRAATPGDSGLNHQFRVQAQNIEAARRAIGYDSVSAYALPDNQFDSIPLLEIIRIVEKEKEQFAPEVIFTHHAGDLNIDHQRAFSAVLTATRPMAGERVETVISFEIPSATEWAAPSDPRPFAPNLFVPIAEEDLQAKVAGMECYEYEKRTYPHPRSPEALRIMAQRHGIRIGWKYAEAFQIVRHIAR